MPTVENFLTNLPDDKEALKAMLLSLWQERERQENKDRDSVDPVVHVFSASENASSTMNDKRFIDAIIFPRLEDDTNAFSIAK